jgi:hypothetical protein
MKYRFQSNNFNNFDDDDFNFIVQLNAKCNKNRKRYYPQSSDRGRGEIGGVYLPPQQERTPQLSL